MPDQQDPRDNQIADWLRTRREDGGSPVDVDAAWSRFAARQELSTPVTMLRPRKVQTVWRIAAVLIAVAGGAAVWRAASDGSSKPLTHEAFALNGQRNTVTLEDGSRVSLNGGSRLRYISSRRGDRDVYLEGEAYFEVVHNEKRPFRVHAKRGVIRDIGTRFSVRAYENQQGVEVAVVEGVVALSADSVSTGVELKAGDLGVLTAAGVATVAHPPSLDGYVGFASGTLVLDKMMLRDVASQLERWYGVSVTVEDSLLATRPVVARFNGQTITQALDAITLALGARYELRGQTYVIRARAKQ
jgi:ferric-dicitrate binding protein FerR (iron transport regulator)